MTLVGNPFPRGLDLGTSKLRPYREDTTGPPHSSSTEIGVPWCPCCAYGGIIGIPSQRSSRLLPPPESWRSTIQLCIRWWSSRVTGAAKALAMPPPEKREELKKDVFPPHPCKESPQTQGIEMGNKELSMWLAVAPFAASHWIRSMYLQPPDGQSYR